MSGYPNSGYPGSNYPSYGYHAPGYPSPNYPSYGYPPPGYPSYPYSGYHQTGQYGYPSSGYPSTGYVDSNYPSQSGETSGYPSSGSASSQQGNTTSGTNSTPEDNGSTETNLVSASKLPAAPNENFRLVPSSRGFPPPDAAPFGQQTDGLLLSLAIGRTQHGDIPGKTEGKRCWCPYGGTEILTENFFSIVHAPGALTLEANSGSGPPSNAVEVGYQHDQPDAAFYCAVANSAWGTIPGKAQGNTCWYGHGGQEHYTSSFSWVVCTPGYKPNLQPIPASVPAMQDEAMKVAESAGSGASPNPRAKLLQYMHNSWLSARSFNRAFMMVLGVTGAGKSSTINHLLGVDYAKTSESQSETRSTTEFIVTMDDSSMDVSDLCLSIIDTPGWDDTDGPAQDACNLLSIQTFCKRHPSLQKCMPNIIVLIIQASDTRFSGKSSGFTMALKTIGDLGIVDRQRPNIVVAMTWACTIPHANISKWKETVESKSIEIKRIVKETLEVDANVVYMENEFKENELPETSDHQQTQLPDGTWQPKNLFTTIAGVLQANRDHLGLMIFSRCSELGFEIGKSCKMGMSIAAKDSQKETLGSKEVEIMKRLKKVKMDG